PAEARMKVEQSLMAVLEETGARLILVSEHSEANTTLDQLADAILILRQKVIDDRRLRELEIRKLRGVPIRQDQYLFTLAGGRFQYLEPFNFKLPEETAEFRPVHNTETHMSTGSRDLDALLGGGVARGSTVLLEMRGDVPFEALDTVENFYGQGGMDFLATVAARVAVNKDIQSVLARPNLELTEKVANISQIHLVLTTRWGTLVFYGVKPRTGFYGLQFSFANGYPEFKLSPLQDVTLSRERSGMPGEPPLAIPVHIRRRAPQADFFETVARSMQNAKKRLIA